MFREAAAPVYDWFKANIKNGPEIFDALTAAASAADEKINAGTAMDLN